LKQSLPLVYSRGLELLKFKNPVKYIIFAFLFFLPSLHHPRSILLFFFLGQFSLLFLRAAVIRLLGYLMI